MTSKYPSVILHMAVYAKILVILSRFLVKIWWKVILSICFSRRFLVHSWVWLSSSCTQSCLPWGILLYSAPESKQWKAPKELCPSSVQSYNNQTRQIHSQVRIRNFLKLALCFLCISKFPTSVFTFLQCVFCSGFFSASPFDLVHIHVCEWAEILGFLSELFTFGLLVLFCSGSCLYRSLLCFEWFHRWLVGCNCVALAN